MVKGVCPYFLLGGNEKLKTRVFLGLLIWVCIVGAVRALTAGEVEGKLLKASGKVEIERDGKKISAQPAMEIRGGDIIVTGKGGEASLDIGEGRVITIRENSYFRVDESGLESGSGKSGMLVYGMVYVRHGKSGPPKPYEIQTPSAVAGVRGTSFAVAAAPDGASLFAVEDGEISVETEGGARQTVGINQQVEVENENARSLRVTSYNPMTNRLDEWRKQRLERVLKNPLPVLRMLGADIKAAVMRGNRILKEAVPLTEKAIQKANSVKEVQRRGQVYGYNEELAELRAVMARLVPMVRRLVRLDNGIQARLRLMKIILVEARAEDSPTPPAQIALIERHIDGIKALAASAEKFHSDYAEFMRTKVAQLRNLAKDMY